MPDELKKVIETDENLLANWLHLLHIADHFGWWVVTEFTATELARTDEEAKKLKKIIKANEAKLERQRELKKLKAKPSYFNQKKIGGFGQGFGQGTGGGSSTEYRYSSLKAGELSFIINPL